MKAQALGKWCAFVAILLPTCSASNPNAAGGPGCAAPPSANTFNGASGCRSNATFMTCEQDPDGGAPNCQRACSGVEYSLECIAGSSTDPIPSPDGALNCTALPVPTPSNELVYCCACSQ